MLVVIPFFSKDASLAAKNLRHWIGLEGTVPYPCMLAYDNDTDAKEVRSLAEVYFTGGVTDFKYTVPPNSKWPYASNWVWQHVVWHLSLKGIKDSWLWVESDAVALRAGWIKSIEDCHKQGGKPFTGHWNEESKVFNGVAVYPPNVNTYLHHAMLCDRNPWDVVASKSDKIERHLNKANHLFQHNWADPATSLPYTFRHISEAKGLIRPTVVLFHRCKDGSLIDVLCGSEAEEEPQLAVDCSNPLVVIPFCAKDCEQAIANMRLAIKLNPKKSDLRCMLSYDDETPVESTLVIHTLARRYFSKVYSYCYDAPVARIWPMPQNHAFVRTYTYIAKHFKGTWFWWEMDAIPVRKNWLIDLVAEYKKHEKPFMGYVVSGMGHMNGVGFYPCDLLSRIGTLPTDGPAFDIAIRPLIAKDTHTANHLFQHCWAFDKAGNHTNGAGEPPTFNSKDDVTKLVDFNCAIFHRCKDGTLAKQLLA